MGERGVSGHKGTSSMTKIRWTDKIPGTVNDVEDAVEMGPCGRATISSPTTRTGFLEQYGFYESNDYMIDND